MLRVALLLSVLPLAVPAQTLQTPFEQPAPLNQEDGQPFPLNMENGQPFTLQLEEGGAFPLQLQEGQPPPPRPEGTETVQQDLGAEEPALVEEVPEAPADPAAELPATPPEHRAADPAAEPVFPFEETPRFDDAPREVREDPQVTSAGGAFLRGLDKVSGHVTDLDLSVGETVQLGRLIVTLGDCRYPVDDPAGDAYAYLTIEAEGMSGPAFEGWMIASSPALSALDHPRYDVWVMRCRSS